jgi:8-oxo-dGTP diphosphatase
MGAALLKRSVKSVRVSVKAIICEGDRILLVKNRDEQGDWYCLPGGGQRAGETLPEALQRECLEEVGLPIAVGRLRYVRDYIGANHEFAEESDGDAHQIELMFECAVHPGDTASLGSAPDSMQIGVRWVSLDGLDQCRLYPKVLVALLKEREGPSHPVYLGDVN